MPGGSIASTARGERAYSILALKSVDEEQRIISGTATTPTTDRMGDVVEPKGAKFNLPLPLLWQHDSAQPIGHVLSAKVTSAGIEIVAQIAKGVLPAIDEAWALIKAGLVRGLSIGFIGLESEPVDPKNPYWGGTKFLAWDWLELSCVTIPANTEASIASIKSFDTQHRRAALGTSGMPHVVHLNNPPGASGSAKGMTMKVTIAQQIAALEAKRVAAIARREEVQGIAMEAGRSKEAAEQEEFDNLTADIGACDRELKDLRIMEKDAVAEAKPVRPSVDDPGAIDTKETGRGVITGMRPNVEKGIPFVRYTKAMVMAKGIPTLALQIAQANKQWHDQTPEVAMVLRAAVAAGDTTSAGWASELVYNANLTSAFLEYLRPMTILGKIQGFTQVPFNVRWGQQTGGATGYWVGQGAPTPVSKLTTGSDSLGIAKAAGLVVLDKELMMSSDPSAEILVRNDLAKTIAQFLDVNFIAPDYPAVANTNPASVTNGVVPTAASGTASSNLRTDAQTLFNTFDVNNLEGGGFFWVTTPKIARAISMMLTSLGNLLFPTVTPEGGTFMGYPLIVSGSAMQVGSPVSGEGNLLVLGHAPSIAMADNGQIVIDASEEASIQMLDNPTNTSTGGTTATTMVSMFQTNSVALRATRFINWSKRRSFAVQYVKDAAYVT